MQEKQTAQVVYTFRTSRSSVVVGLLGLVALVVGIVAPAPEFLTRQPVVRDIAAARLKAGVNDGPRAVDDDR